MIAVDTSAILAVVFREVRANDCLKALAANSPLFISAATLAETRIVAARRNRVHELDMFLESLNLQIVSVEEATAIAVGHAYEKWGKGLHRASLNFGDCFAYVLAYERNCPLLYIGNDFSQTDIASALRGP